MGRLRVGRFYSLTQFSNGAHGLHRAPDDLRGSYTVSIVDGLRLEQFRVREQDPELVVQTVKERAKLLAGICLELRVCWRERNVHAGDPGTVLELGSLVDKGSYAEAAARARSANQQISQLVQE